ncbi:phosphomethylpyrimidine kinase [Fructobacillus pseudoficulneus]|uniref:pyridoxal kinase n=1 Tax=Fructobacillus pseudoficulneus TaxID=220714 RepID=A0A3F3H562_9LACO|nr:hydroxymethylpyrimidine/phosphomethylpyrimidine kinase [Fructobacillus pseudoficulneus]GAP02169.1 phosphomethylpyrimidine kinase [Fructobacillus pseudoficulneus]SEH35963.1 pyridoxine kinase [Fructobacillus pseudoficulneus]
MKEKKLKKVLTIAGSDSLAGGGLQADLATFARAGLAGFSVLTSVVSIKTDAVEVFAVPDAVLQAQLSSVTQVDDFAAIKVGLLNSISQLDMVVDFIKDFDCPIVVDPVLALKEGELAENPALVEAYRNKLLPLATICTPNFNEGLVLVEKARRNVQTAADLSALGRQLSQQVQTTVLQKGGLGFLPGQTLDVLAVGQTVQPLSLPALAKDASINGAGCTLAAAITSYLALGLDLEEAVTKSQQFVHQGIAAGYHLNQKRLDGNVFQAGVAWLE